LTTPIEIGKKLREKIVTRYFPVDKTEIPTEYTLSPIEYKKGTIEDYGIIFWHRLLRNLFDVPTEIECEIQGKDPQPRAEIQTAFFRKTGKRNIFEVIGIDKAAVAGMQAEKMQPLPINWKYLIRLPSGGIVELGTKDKNTTFYIAQVILPEHDRKSDSQEAERLISLLIEEANRLKSQLFSNPVKEFERQEGVRLYLLFNVYLSNYLSAKTMLGMAEGLEAELSQEFLRYDASTSDLYDEEKRKHIDQHMLTRGMYYCSAISYFFMALEGFINLVFHAFLKKRFRDKEFRTDRRFDLEQKLRLMSVLCEGFNESSELPTSVLSGFKKLKDYRNSLFHSKVEDSLKSLCFVEDGFFYSYDLDEYKDHFLPTHKIKLTVNDVIEVNKLVDDIVKYILGSMNQGAKVTTETSILREPHIPIVVLETGELVVGKTGLQP